jgi:hypothetical protein
MPLARGSRVVPYAYVTAAHEYRLRPNGDSNASAVLYESLITATPPPVPPRPDTAQVSCGLRSYVLGGARKRGKFARLMILRSG